LCKAPDLLEWIAVDGDAMPAEAEGIRAADPSLEPDELSGRSGGGLRRRPNLVRSQPGRGEVALLSTTSTIARSRSCI
jgi:hypothetical protein